MSYCTSIHQSCCNLNCSNLSSRRTAGVIAIALGTIAILAIVLKMTVFKQMHLSVDVTLLSTGGISMLLGIFLILTKQKKQESEITVKTRVISTGRTTDGAEFKSFTSLERAVDSSVEGKLSEVEAKNVVTSTVEGKLSELEGRNTLISIVTELITLRQNLTSHKRTPTPVPKMQDLVESRSRSATPVAEVEDNKIDVNNQELKSLDQELKSLDLGLRVFDEDVRNLDDRAEEDRKEYETQTDQLQNIKLQLCEKLESIQSDLPSSLRDYVVRIITTVGFESDDLEDILQELKNDNL